MTVIETNLGTGSNETVTKDQTDPGKAGYRMPETAEFRLGDGSTAVLKSYRSFSFRGRVMFDLLFSIRLMVCFCTIMCCALSYLDCRFGGYSKAGEGKR